MKFLFAFNISGGMKGKYFRRENIFFCSLIDESIDEVNSGTKL